MTATNNYTADRVKRAFFDSLESLIKHTERESTTRRIFRWMLNRENETTGVLTWCDECGDIIEKLSQDTSLRPCNRELLNDLRSGESSLDRKHDDRWPQSHEEALHKVVQSTIRLLAQQADSATCLKRLLKEELETVHAFAWCDNFPNRLEYLSGTVGTVWGRRLLGDLHKTCSRNWEHQVMRADLISDWCRNETCSKELDALFRLEGWFRSTYRGLADWVQDIRKEVQNTP